MKRLYDNMNGLYAKYGIDLQISQADERVYLTTDTKQFPIIGSSKGQKFMAEITFRISVLQIQPSTCLKFITIDEDLECLDEHNRGCMIRMIKESGIPFIVVSHSEQEELASIDQLSIGKCAANCAVLRYGQQMKISTLGYIPIDKKRDNESEDSTESLEFVESVESLKPAEPKKLKGARESKNDIGPISSLRPVNVKSISMASVVSHFNELPTGFVCKICSTSIKMRTSLRRHLQRHE